MDAIWMAVTLAAAGWVIKKLLDWLLDYFAERWRNRVKPLTNTQVRRHHRNRLFVAIGYLVVSVVAALIAIVGIFAAPDRNPLEVLIVVGLIALAVYAWRVTRRRWRRRREYETWWGSYRGPTQDGLRGPRRHQ
jgi:membrane protein YqaA with SNARE-associated domain